MEFNRSGRPQIGKSVSVSFRVRGERGEAKAIERAGDRACERASGGDRFRFRIVRASERARRSCVAV